MPIDDCSSWRGFRIFAGSPVRTRREPSRPDSELRHTVARFDFANRGLRFREING